MSRELGKASHKPGSFGEAVTCRVITGVLHWNTRCHPHVFPLIGINTKKKKKEKKIPMTPPSTDNDFNLSEYCLLIF